MAEAHGDFGVAETPNLNALAAGGLVFEAAWHVRKATFFVQVANAYKRS